MRAPSNSYQITDITVSIANKHIPLRGASTAQPHALHCLCAYFAIGGYPLKDEEWRETMHVATVLELLQASFLVTFLRGRKWVVNEIGLFMLNVNFRKLSSESD